MAKPDFIAQLAQQASKLMNNGPEIQQDIEEKVQVLLQGGFSRSKLETLEKQLAELTEQLANQTGSNT